MMHPPPDPGSPEHPGHPPAEPPPDHEEDQDEGFIDYLADQANEEKQRNKREKQRQSTIMGGRVPTAPLSNEVAFVTLMNHRTKLHLRRVLIPLVRMCFDWQ